MIFLDSSAIVAYKNADDINHKKAAGIFQKLNAGDYGIGVISEFVFSEVTERRPSPSIYARLRLAFIAARRPGSLPGARIFIILT